MTRQAHALLTLVTLLLHPPIYVGIGGGLEVAVMYPVQNAYIELEMRYLESRIFRKQLSSLHFNVAVVEFGGTVGWTTFGRDVVDCDPDVNELPCAKVGLLVEGAPEALELVVVVAGCVLIPVLPPFVVVEA